MRKFFLALAVGFLLGGSSLRAGVIEGQVKFTGKVPRRRPLRLTPECKKLAAGKKFFSERVVVGPNGGLQNVFVYLKSGVDTSQVKPPKKEVVLDQQACVYVPHVVGVMVGQPLKILNSDPTLHNVHSLSKKNPSFNMGMATKGQSIVKKFKRPEVAFRVKCDVHAWMNAYVAVVKHPYFAVSDAQGHFKIEGVPDGDYTLEAWHEKYKVKTASVKVSGGKATVAISYP